VSFTEAFIRLAIWRQWHGWSPGAIPSEALLVITSDYALERLLHMQRLLKSAGPS